jgi:hypothetical protein
MLAGNDTAVLFLIIELIYSTEQAAVDVCDFLFIT